MRTALAILIAMLWMGVGCDNDDSVGDAIDDAGDAVEDAADDAGDAVKDATN